ncbi:MULTISPECIES: LVIVD repeat-containing protein [Sphingobacterium]|nr:MULTISPECIES: hypothetical protein [Sphingobacterium]QQT44060.1 hypothetical protein I6J00_20325 [Sphingobacterium multivorum]QQT63188.1 hypothetical protein I6I97_05140 [Sphingobacterium multivorum]SUJ09442.1 LVIVD repeat [Sphingobacterium multivorum]VXC85024.1 LVIVD repeat [Sphingobacterium multivorum]
MKRIWLILLGCIALSSCDKIESKGMYLASVPIFETMESIRAKANPVSGPTTIVQTGKIYIYQDYLFINEPGKGVHIFNNVDPSKPVAMAFLSIPGNVDLAVLDGKLYADSFTDLLTFDLENPASPKLLTRNKDVFKMLLQMDYLNNTADRIITGYRDSLVSYSQKDKYSPYDRKEPLYNETNSGSGQGGSMARFTIANKHLYAVDQTMLHLFDVQNASKPAYVKDIKIGPGIETIFPFKNNLFIGSNTGMVIYDITTASAPVELSRYTHIRACDPVVVNEKYAFVTLRAGVVCGGQQNLLEVIDIQDLTKPMLKHSFTLENPYGLALSDHTLYICDGKFGLKSFDASDVSQIGNKLLETHKDLMSMDVIAGPKSLIIVGEKGVHQYDYSNKAKLKELSIIPVIRPN